ncbi:MAG: DUF4249 family protein [Candidatus Neomarinimicrobiota bacterium]
MKKTFLFISLALIALTSCEQVIDIDLNLADPALVINGKIVQDSLVNVCIQETTSYFSPDSQRCIDSAIVIITEDNNSPDTLLNIGFGRYSSKSLKGKAGSSYNMKVILNHQEYEADSFLPIAPLIYELGTLPLLSFFGSDSGSESNFPPGGRRDSIPNMLISKLYQDPSEDDYFLMQYYLNGENISKPYDPVSDASAENDTLNIRLVSGFYLGDTIVVKAYSVDKDVFTYFDMLEDVLSGNIFSASTPYNPHSNISNGALGVFSAMNVSSDTVIISAQIPVISDQ